jgi:hypothetical protein
MKVKVYLALVTHRHGENVYAAGSQKELRTKLYGYVAGSWAEFRKTRPLPRSEKAAISQYFDVAKEFGAYGEFLTYHEDEIEVNV